jgi:hypothetical protein
MEVFGRKQDKEREEWQRPLQSKPEAALAGAGGDAAVRESYVKVIEVASTILRDALLAQPEDCKDVNRLEGALQPMVREIARRAEQAVLEKRAEQVVAEQMGTGRRLERRTRVSFEGLFGAMEVESPYFSRGKTVRGARPVQAELCVMARGRSERLQRALTDFGAEESFENAARRFEEHYGWSVGRTSVLRLVEKVAREAETFVEAKLKVGLEKADGPEPFGCAVAQMLVEMDGCEIRTGKLVPAPELGQSEVRKLDKRKRETQWRDVRMGLARPLTEVEPTYVGKLAKYPEVVRQMRGAAGIRGLSSKTEVVACTDGGNGIREEIETQFSNVRYILDRCHATSHLSDTADAKGLDGVDKERWVAHQMARLDGGDVQLTLDELAAHRGRGRGRAEQLHQYLSRFKDAVHYDALKAAGLPIGSGEIEAAHRIVPQKRLKLPGAWWNEKTINPMLALRVLRANGWWNEFWSQRIAA